VTTATVTEPPAALRDLDRFLRAREHMRNVPCDTPGCASVQHGGGWAAAVDAGWRTDPAGLRRCAACLSAGWPYPLPDTRLRVPEAHYRAWWAGDPGKLTAWLDRKYGPLTPPAGTAAEPPAGGQAEPPPLGELDDAAEAHLAEFERLHTEQAATEKNAAPAAAEPEPAAGQDEPEVTPLPSPASGPSPSPGRWPTATGPPRSRGSPAASRRCRRRKPPSFSKPGLTPPSLPGRPGNCSSATRSPAPTTPACSCTY
jgi:hypothetical protein